MEEPAGALPTHDVTLDLAPGTGRPAQLRVRDLGTGPAVAVLHGGWGYRVYPYDRELQALSARQRVVAPDRVGYGGSSPADSVPPRHQERMAEETMLMLDALAIERAALWGHSDGAVVAAWCAIRWPHRVRALVLEALHYLAWKPGSLEFFHTAAEAPERFGETICQELLLDHGPRWKALLQAGGRAWLRIIEEGRAGRRDLYDGRFGEIACPTLLLHGRRDPRTEPGEIEAALAALPAARVHWVEAGHSPHTSATAGEEASRAAVEFLEAAPG